MDHRQIDLAMHLPIRQRDKKLLFYGGSVTCFLNIKKSFCFHEFIVYLLLMLLQGVLLSLSFLVNLLSSIGLDLFHGSTCR